MRAIDFPETKGIVLRAPEGYEGEVYDLPYCPVLDIRGAIPIPMVTTCYELNKEEVDELIKTGKLWVSFWGYTIPPVMLCVENPFELGIVKATI